MLLNPLIEVNNLIEITDSFYGIENEKFLVQSISFSLDYSGTMSISSSNINNLSFTNREGGGEWSKQNKLIAF